MDPLTSLQDRLHEELKRRVILTTAKKPLHPVNYVTPKSSAEEVQFWLTAKGFAARYVLWLPGMLMWKSYHILTIFMILLQRICFLLYYGNPPITSQNTSPIARKFLIPWTGFMLTKKFRSNLQNRQKSKRKL